MTKNGADAMPVTTQRRRRSRVSCRVLLGTILLTLVATACSDSTVTSGTEPATVAPTEASAAAPADESTEVPGLLPVAPDATATPNEPTATVVVETAPQPTPHPIAVADTELPSAPIGFESLFDTAPAGPQPVSIEIENINVRDATVIPVGINAEDLSFEVPPADQVGWYEFGPTPGEAGSAVLAAHIAFDGVDGVFRYLENVEIGAVVVIGFDDGTSQRYRIEEVTEYVKEALPESLWARDGKEQLALITCGGAFNYQLNSYESNTVAIAVPI